uniref:Uncharacterized protein n=1 Tax=Heterorhabditis bacteriophora TaxID=37862 RepID=A0A1I7XE55_HETBA
MDLLSYGPGSSTRFNKQSWIPISFVLRKITRPEVLITTTASLSDAILRVDMQLRDSIGEGRIYSNKD